MELVDLELDWIEMDAACVTDQATFCGGEVIGVAPPLQVGDGFG